MLVGQFSLYAFCVLLQFATNHYSFSLLIRRQNTLYVPLSSVAAQEWSNTQITILTQHICASLSCINTRNPLIIGQWKTCEIAHTMITKIVITKLPKITWMYIYLCLPLFSFLCYGERQRPQALFSTSLSHYQQPALHLTWCWVTMVLYLNVQPFQPL